DVFMRDHVKAKQLRSYDDIESLFRRYVRPVLGRRRTSEVKRSEVSKLLSDVAARPSKASRAMRSAIAVCTSTTQRTALTTLATSSSSPSPVVGKAALFSHSGNPASRKPFEITSKAFSSRVATQLRRLERRIDGTTLVNVLQAFVASSILPARAKE